MDTQALFVMEDGRHVKFFLQKDLAPKIIEDLAEKITPNGGRVEAKVPIQGFILIEPKSPEGLRLIDCWSTTDRPLRYFVPHTFVEACAQAGKVLPQVFRKNGEPIMMHIHSSITNEKTVKALHDRIRHSGGDIAATDEDADVIIADQCTPVFRTLIERYDHYRNKYVEPIHWVEQCVEAGLYKTTPVAKKNLGGRSPGTTRIEFSPTDDTNLASYIARRLPDSGMRGRIGNKLYQDLCAQPDLYPWATRHPWQSWRERYKNNASRFAMLIAEQLERHPIPEDGKGLHGFFRVPTASPGKARTKDPSPTQFDDKVNEPRQQRDPEGFDVEWGSQWDVRVGNSRPPGWAVGKRRADNDLVRPTKRMKTTPAGCGSAQALRKNDTIIDVIRVGAATEAGGDSLELRLPGNVSNVLEDGNVESSVAIAEDAVSYSSKTQTDSADSNEVVGPAPESSIMNSESDDERLGPETQTFLAAHRNMVAGPSTGPSVYRSPGSSKDKTQEIQNQPRSTKLSTTIRQQRTEDCAPDPEIEHAIVRIACEHRFVMEEVKEEYEALNRDLDATRLHFQELRAMITMHRKMRKDSSKSQLE